MAHDRDSQAGAVMMAFVVGAIVYGSKHETEAYKRSELE